MSRGRKIVSKTTPTNFSVSFLVSREGAHCDVCVPLPGCMHGFCDDAFECRCIDGWEGAFCTIRESSLVSFKVSIKFFIKAAEAYSLNK